MFNLKLAGVALIMALSCCPMAYAQNEQNKTSSSNVNTPESAASSGQKTNSDKGETKAVISEGETIEVSVPTYYGSPARAMLDESVRGITTPSKGTAFGLIQERRVRVKLDTDVLYDSNIFLTKDNTKDDIITRLSPGIYAYTGNESNMFLGFYEADVLIYSKNNPKATRINQVIGGRVDLFKTSPVKINIKDTLRPTSDPATSEIRGFVKRVGNDFAGTVRYDMSPKTSADFTYSQYLEYYLSGDYKGYNYLTHTFAPTFYYHISPKTSLTAEYAFGLTHYMGGKDFNSSYQQGRLGIEGKLTPKSTIFLRSGYQYRVYENSDMKNGQGFVMEGVYDYRLSPKTAVELIVSSNLDESTYSNVGYYRGLNFFAFLNHRLLPNVDVNACGFYIRNDYPHVAEGFDTKRTDNLYGAGGKIAYRYKYWLSFYAGYDFKACYSNIRVFDYIDNIVSGGAKIDF